MRLEPLYRISFAYPEHYLSRGPETVGLFFGEGRVEGQVNGRFRGLNHARLRRDDIRLEVAELIWEKLEP
ncbi:MAG TPA: hypothetical protein VMR48_01825 [Gaiellaceae bacterium]|nr:hypothetical protein [Gaiellaceae bacterium]